MNCQNELGMNAHWSQDFLFSKRIGLFCFPCFLAAESTGGDFAAVWPSVISSRAIAVLLSFSFLFFSAVL